MRALPPYRAQNRDNYKMTVSIVPSILVWIGASFLCCVRRVWMAVGDLKMLCLALRAWVNFNPTGFSLVILAFADFAFEPCFG